MTTELHIPSMMLITILISSRNALVPYHWIYQGSGCSLLLYFPTIFSNLASWVPVSTVKVEDIRGHATTTL